MHLPFKFDEACQFLCPKRIDHHLGQLLALNGTAIAQALRNYYRHTTQRMTDEAS